MHDRSAFLPYLLTIRLADRRLWRGCWLNHLFVPCAKLSPRPEYELNESGRRRSNNRLSLMKPWFIACVFTPNRRAIVRYEILLRPFHSRDLKALSISVQGTGTTQTSNLLYRKWLFNVMHRIRFIAWAGYGLRFQSTGTRFCLQFLTSHLEVMHTFQWSTRDANDSWSHV